MTMSAVMTKSATAAALALAAIALSGCLQTRLRISDDFGRGVRQNVVAQIADPDAQYKGVPGPASSGMRSGLAQEKYNHNAVTRPASTSTSSVGGGGGGGGGGAPSS